MDDGKPQLSSERPDTHEILGCYLAVTLLLCFCGARGYWLVRGLPFPPYSDSLRDLGFIRGIVDGNLFGDPTNAGAWRWYPPLLHFIGAAAVKLTGADPAALWLGAAPWINLLAPATFFLLSRSLIGIRAATFATFAFVFLNGALTYPWDTATYAPWPYTPILAEAFFYATVLIIYHRIGTRRLLDAVQIGAAIGLTYLAHAVPGLILIPIVAVAAVTVQGPRLRTLVWLVVAGGVAACFALLFMGPLIVDYHLRVLNILTVLVTGGIYVPGHTLLLVLLHLPAVIAVAVIVALADWRTPDRKVVAILGAWLLGSAIPLARHFVCWPVPNGHRVCDAFALPIHHFHVYLQAAETVLIGYAACLLYRRVFGRAQAPARGRLWAGRAILAGIVVAGATAFLMRSNDRDMAERVASGSYFDVDLYRWLSANTQPHDLFVTDLPTDYFDPAAQSVFSAGRRLVAANHINSNPYLDWVERNRRRLAYYRAAIGASDGSPDDLCRLAAEAGPDDSAYVILPINLQPVSSLGPRLFQSQESAVYRLDHAACHGP
jgi:hypothetical protein